MRIILERGKGDFFDPSIEGALDEAYPLARALCDVAGSHIGHLVEVIEVVAGHRTLADSFEIQPG